jgi:hypothetical protein
MKTDFTISRSWESAAFSVCSGERATASRLSAPAV